MAKTTPDRPVSNLADANPGETVVTDTGMTEAQLAAEDQQSKAANPDTPQETTGGVEPRESNPQRVRYRGMGQRRRITEGQWRSAGVNDQETVEWNRLNKWSLPVGGEGGLSDSALQLISGEAEFKVE